jgi:hypothetical protein
MGNPSVLDGKMNGGTIPVFSHSTGITYNKNESTVEQKINI